MDIFSIFLTIWNFIVDFICIVIMILIWDALTLLLIWFFIREADKNRHNRSVIMDILGIFTLVAFLYYFIPITIVSSSKGWGWGVFVFFMNSYILYKIVTLESSEIDWSHDVTTSKSYKEDYALYDSDYYDDSYYEIDHKTYKPRTSSRKSKLDKIIKYYKNQSKKRKRKKF